MYTFSPMMVANSRKHHCRVRPYTREVLVFSTNLEIQTKHYSLVFRDRRGDEARIKKSWTALKDVSSLTDMLFQSIVKNRMLLCIKGKEHGRMMINSIEHGPLVYGTIEVDGVTKTKTYEEITDAEKLQDDCDVKATNIVLQGLPPEVYSLVNHHHVAKEIWD
ncbi:hypothetical protein Tco_1482896 [Tanacetum coccineum]